MRYSAFYDAYWRAQDPSEQAVQENFSDLADTIISTCGNGLTLDVGCGAGGLIRALLLRYTSTYGVDCSSYIVSQCAGAIPGRLSVANALSLPFGNCSFATVTCINVLQHLDQNDIFTVLRELYRVTTRSVFLKVSIFQEAAGSLLPTNRSRSWWEKQCLAAGFEIHPGDFHATSYEVRNYELGTYTIILEKCGTSQLQSEKNTPFINCLRSSDRHAESFRFQCHEVSRSIQKNAVVLSICPDVGASSHILYHNSLASKVLGVSHSREAVSHARLAYGLADKIVFFQQEIPGYLSVIADNSVDFAFVYVDERLNQNFPSVLESLKRVLRPAARVVFSFHASNLFVEHWKYLFAELSSAFVLEKLHTQTGGREECTAWRDWHRFRMCDELPTKAEWILVQGVTDPVPGREIPYVEKYHIAPEDWKFHDGGKSETYDNPWVFTSLTSLSVHNVENAKILAARIIAASRFQSLDYAHALCFLAYRELDSVLCNAVPHELLVDIDRWVSSSSGTPGELRWEISLLYVKSLILLRHGLFPEAESELTRCSSIDPLQITPTLGTKTISARHILAQLAIARHDKEGAQRWLRDAISETWRLLVEGGIDTIGTFDALFEPGIIEMSRIMAIAHNCLVLLANIDSVDSRLGCVLNSDLLLKKHETHNSHALFENGMEVWRKRLEKQEVYFWGCGEFYRCNKYLFKDCIPVRILIDQNPEGLLEVDGIPVAHPKDVLTPDNKIPIVIFSWHPWIILQKISDEYPFYHAEDIVIPLESWHVHL